MGMRMRSSIPLAVALLVAFAPSDSSAKTPHECFQRLPLSRGGFVACAHQVRVVSLDQRNLTPSQYRIRAIRPWLIPISLIGLAGLGLWLLRWHLIKLRERNEILETMIQSRTQELEAAQRALAESSFVDSVTGLRNRSFLDLAIPDEVARIRRTYKDLLNKGLDPLQEKEDMIFCLLEVEPVPDPDPEAPTYVPTSVEIDSLHAQIADTLRAITRASDTLLRWDDARFLIIIKQTQRSNAPNIIQGLLDSFKATAFQTTDGQKVNICCFLGFAPYPMHPRYPRLGSWRQVIDVADQCFQAAKRCGGDCWVGASTDPKAPLEPFGNLDAWDIPWAMEHGIVEALSSRQEFKWPEMG